MLHIFFTRYNLQLTLALYGRASLHFTMPRYMPRYAHHHYPHTHVHPRPLNSCTYVSFAIHNVQFYLPRICIYIVYCLACYLVTYYVHIYFLFRLHCVIMYIVFVVSIITVVFVIIYCCLLCRRLWQPELHVYTLECYSRLVVFFCYIHFLYCLSIMLRSPLSLSVYNYRSLRYRFSFSFRLWCLSYLYMCTHLFLYIILVKFSFFFSVVTGVPSLL